MTDSLSKPVDAVSTENQCDHCKGTGTSAGPAGPDAYPCPFCVGVPGLGTISEFLNGAKDRLAKKVHPTYTTPPSTVK